MSVSALSVRTRAEAETHASDASSAPPASEAVSSEHGGLEKVCQPQQEHQLSCPHQVPGQVSANAQVNEHLGQVPGKGSESTQLVTGHSTKYLARCEQ